MEDIMYTEVGHITKWNPKYHTISYSVYCLTFIFISASTIRHKFDTYDSYITLIWEDLTLCRFVMIRTVLKERKTNENVCLKTDSCFEDFNTS